ncbi:STAS-like domain-containing protein [Wohlfahrtiimonas chitiniclastica]|uniref:STAS-like domain-containing protein n=1 Tax=Wohlfahrtiimonas chitiniclastica TaxID=400946 RepID=UPI001BCD82BE|nr:STAS-like domain-containing protein [Wohlfahrtiimonas chitiniclastica]MBS7827428.1 STAS-like domain-containing protein [Wohlfahrtiimonas chitiniclastica]
MSVKKIYVAKEFSEIPYGRYDVDGPDNGERFREKFLVDAFKNYNEVYVYLDGAMGYGSSFLDEAFAGLYRTNHIDKSVIKQKLKIFTELNFLEDSIWEYIEEAVQE